MKATPYEIPLRIPYVWAKGVQVTRRGLLVNHKGHWGEVAPPPHDVPTDKEMLAEFQRVTEGLDPDSPHYLEQVDTREPNCRVRCGISTAWHLANRTDFGPRAKQVPVNGLVTGDAIEAEAKALIDRGITTFKLKIHGTHDIDRVRRLRLAIGATNGIRLDANESLGEGALEYLQRVAEYTIEYIEQPLSSADVEGLCRLQRESGVDIALDESATDASRIAELLDCGAGRVVILKPQRLGGPDRAIEAMHTALSRGARVVVTNSLETEVGISLARFVASHIPEPIPPCGLDTARFLLQQPCRAAL